MTTTDRPLVRTRQGLVAGVRAGDLCTFRGIPFAEAPVGERRFAAPVPRAPWEGTLDASGYGPTAQRRPFGPEVAIPEPSIPGDDILTVNVTTPSPDPAAKLPVLLWIHGGGYFAGSPASPWYDGRSHARDGVVTVTCGYRLGFDGFGWIADAPANRGVLDWVAALEWVQQNVAAFGGDPDRVTVSGQSAGGGAVLTLLTMPRARGLFRRVVSHSGAVSDTPLEVSRATGEELARLAGVAPTRAGWSTLTEDQVLDVQGKVGSALPSGAGPVAAVRTALRHRGASSLPLSPVVDGETVPLPFLDAVAAGHGRDVPLVAGATAHEFSMGVDGAAGHVTDADVLAASPGGLPVAGLPEGAPPERRLGQLLTAAMFRIPLLELARARAASGADATWVFDFRLVSPVLGLAQHCLDVPFAFDVLDDPHVPNVAGPNPPQAVADALHPALVRFFRDGDPGWEPWRGTDGAVRVFDHPDAGTVAGLPVEAALLEALREG